MPWEDSLKRNDAILVALLDAPQRRVLQVGLVVLANSVALRYDTRVYAGSVAVPHLKESLRNRLARVHVDDLDVQCHGDALLIFGNILTHEFTFDPVRALGHLGCKDAGVVSCEEGGGISIGGNTSHV